jgi:hypothetical protein
VSRYVIKKRTSGWYRYKVVADFPLLNTDVVRSMHRTLKGAERGLALLKWELVKADDGRCGAKVPDVWPCHLLSGHTGNHVGLRDLGGEPEEWADTAPEAHGDDA